jgi:hypothetical protein
MLDDALVCCLDVLSLEVADNRGKATLIIDWVGWRSGVRDDTVGFSNAVIVLSVCGRLMDNTHTTVCCDIGVVQHLEAVVLELIIEVIEQRLVFPAYHVLSLQLLNNLEFGLLGILVQCA